MDDDKALCAEIRPLISRFRELPLGHDGRRVATSSRANKRAD